MQGLRQLRVVLRWIVLCLPLCWLSSGLYLTTSVWRLLATLAGGMLTGLGFGRFFHRRHQLQHLDQFRLLLEYLSARLSAGHTLESALQTAAPALQSQVGRQSRMGRSLTRLAQQLRAQVTLSACLQRFRRSFPCSRSDQILSVLPWLRQSGGQMDRFVRNTHRMLNEELNMLREIEAEQSQKSSEAVIMTLMPFVLVLLLQSSMPGYTGPASGTDLTTFVHFILVILAYLAICLTLIILAADLGETPKKQKPQAARNKKLTCTKLVWLLNQFYLSFTPGQIGFRLSRFIIDGAHGETAVWQHYLARKVNLLVLGLALALMLFAFQMLPWHLCLLLLPLFSLLQDFDAWSASRKRRQVCQILYPGLINLMSTFLQSGLSLRKCLDLTLRSQLDSLPQRSSILQELKHIEQHLAAGGQVADALSQMIHQVFAPEIQSAFQLMLRYEQDGGNELLELLQMQATACWQISRQARRQLLERRALLLMIPMGLDLILVITAAMLPALISFQMI